MGVNMSLSYWYARTPLHCAFLSRNEAAVSVLLQMGADIDAKDGLGATALYKAVVDNNILITRMLLKHGANVNAKSGSSETPLDQAIRCSPWVDNYQVVQKLLRHGAVAHTLKPTVSTPA